MKEKKGISNSGFRSILFLIVLLAASSTVWGANVITNGTFDSDLSDWLFDIQTANGTRSWDNSVYGVSQGSFRYMTDTGRRKTFLATDSIYIPQSINQSDPVTLSLYWYKTASAVAASTNDIYIYATPAGTGTRVELWSELTSPNSGQVLDGNVVNLDVSSGFPTTGNYYLVIAGNVRGGNNGSANTQFNLDDIILDVQTAANNAPTVTAGATAVSVSPVNRYSTNTTVISTDFTDSDQPGVGAFFVTFKIREPNNSTELTLVNNLQNGAGGLTITDNGGGSYTADYTYNPDDAQTLGLYDLYFEVSDGTDNAIDDYADNTDELEINEIIPNNAPTVVAGATAVSVSPVNRYSTNTTVISIDFTDSDQPGIGAFFVTFKIREPNNSTELTLVNNLQNGAGGLTITDNGGGSYTADYTYNPDDAQTLGLYDLYFEVSDGTDNAIDDYPDNTDELEVNEILPNNAPTVIAGATAVSVSPVNRYGSNTTVISTDFTDSDQPGIGAFFVTFRVREPNNSTELTLVNNLQNGAGGLTITDNGGGSYTADYSYNPDDAQTLGLYDLYFEVSDGTDNVIDLFDNNLDELEIIEILPNNAPTIIAGATAVSVSPVNRYSNNTTVISTDFTDSDQPGVSVFFVTFKIREPNNSTELTLVNTLQNGSGGLTITDNGGGSYTADYTYNPDDAQTLGLYDLYFEVSDGTDSDIDSYTDNTDELEINEILPNNAPTVVAGATAVSVSPVNRYSNNTTVISTDFTDSDQPGVGSFFVTFKIREPNNSTELTLVNNLQNGSGGLTITDNGGGSYTADYTYNPDDAQTLGLYDLYFEVSDGSDNAIDNYGSNTDELEINEIIANSPPVVVAGATAVTVSPVARAGTETTTIYADFTDSDQPGINAFTVTFKVRRPNNIQEDLLVDNQNHGAGGLTIIDNGGGSYTAQYSWDPASNQTLGLYDLYFDVSDGSDSDLDIYDNNIDELEVIDQPPNNAPTVIAGATAVSVSPVNRYGSNTTVISTDFTDSDQPGVSAFFVTFKIREPNNSTELTLVNNLQNGAGGLTITDNGSGSYTADYTYNPDDAQTLGLYDLYFEASDGTDNAIDDYANNTDELEINEILPNNAPTVIAGATAVSVSPVNRFSTNTTVISTDFTDSDQPGVSAFFVTFKIREPNNTSELTLVDNLQSGSGGLTITDNGGGSYTADYTYNPDDAQTLGLYDLYFEVSDGTDSDIDNYADNLDELEINEVIINNIPLVSFSATNAIPASVNRIGSSNTKISANFSDSDQPGVGAFTATFKIREPDDIGEIILVNNQANGSGGLTITDLGGGSYRAEYTYNPADAQELGFYDLYFEVSDGSDNAVDGYNSNLNELEVIEVVANEAPTLTPGTTAVVPGSLDRLGATTTTISATFNDTDDPGSGAFYVTFKVRETFIPRYYTIADLLQDGQSGLTITDNGGGSYTASISWDPADNITLGYYDLYFMVSDGIDNVEDFPAANLDELLITNGGENLPPVVPSDNTFASPAGLERIGANSTTISAIFTDGDQPAVGAFTIMIKLRQPDDIGEIILANNISHGTGGLTVSDDGGGIYTASISWDPADGQTIGYYDLYFHVTDGADTSIDNFSNNLDELELYDAISNNAPTITADTTKVVPNSVNRIGSEFTMIKTVFSDIDVPGKGTFTVTIKVRDQASTEYTLVNAAKHKEQGLRIKHLSGSDYEATVLWDPPEAQTTGTYDLYFYVEDNDAASAVDGYTGNADELILTSSTILGDGNLLHRTNDADGCGGTASACHNIADHQGQNCLVCHTPHSTKNIYLIRDTIQTPSSGAMEVIFKTLGIGDPYNDPDPIVGDPNSGVMADSTDNVFTGICEVCHVEPTGHHRNDGSQPGPNHNDATDCTGCHPHDEGFAVSGGAESSGGSSCNCHGAIFSGMDSTSVAHRHILANNDADYSPGIVGMYSVKNCLTCHVDHDIFRPDLNAGFGTRAKNLRVDYSIDPVQGDNTVLSNSDYSSSGLGGICLSCHSGPSCLGCHSAHKAPLSASSFTHTFVPKADYDAATSAHNYNVPMTFSKDGSTFQANCTKCHNDNMSKSYQSSAFKVSAHASDYSKLLDTNGVTAPSDPIEEDFCFKCHSTTSNPNAGSNLDYFGVKSMTNQGALDIEAAFSRTYTHPTLTFSGRHSMIDSALSFADGNRHAECEDCHNPHAAQQGTHDGSSNLVSNALKGTWGVEPTSWPAAPTPTDNANVFVAPSGYTKVQPAQKEYQICLKCHSNYTTLPSGARNLAAEINPNYPSTHGITIANQNPYCNTTTMFEPWGSSGSTYCSDCHRSSNPADPEGPHGSNAEHLLVATIVSDDNIGTPLCDVCHDPATYWDGNASASRYGEHPSSKGAHQLPKGCFSCHMWDFALSASVGVSNQSEVFTDGELFVHGQNKKWVYKDDDGSTGTGQAVDAFCNGYLADVDYTNMECWSDGSASGCSHNHNGSGY